MDQDRGLSCPIERWNYVFIKEFLMIRIIAISGSLRKKSSNSALLRAAAALAPEGVEVSLYGNLGELPLFNPDLDGADREGIGPAPVLDFALTWREPTRS